MADMELASHRFCDLPAELRVRIYDIQVAHFTEETLQNRIDPPVTRVSRLLRAESLPVFYSTCTFRIALRVVDWHGNEKASLDTDSLLFIENLTSTGIQTLRRVDNLVTPIREFGRGFRWQFETDLAARTLIESTADMTSYSMKCAIEGGYAHRLLGSVETALAKMFDEVVGRDGDEKCRAQDLLRLENKV